MARRVFLTELRREWREAYIEAHKNMPPKVLEVYHRAGMKHCSVFLLGSTLVLLVEADDPEAMFKAIENDPDDAEWQARVRPMKGEGDWQPMDPVFYQDFD